MDQDSHDLFQVQELTTGALKIGVMVYSRFRTNNCVNMLTATSDYRYILLIALAVGVSPSLSLPCPSVRSSVASEISILSIISLSVRSFVRRLCHNFPFVRLIVCLFIRPSPLPASDIILVHSAVQRCSSHLTCPSSSCSCNMWCMVSSHVKSVRCWIPVYSVISLAYIRSSVRRLIARISADFDSVDSVDSVTVKEL